jgi:hypothetical protein
MNTFRVVPAALLLPLGLLPAQTEVQTSAYRNSVAQEEVRRQAVEIRRQLKLMLEDFRINGLTSPELARTRQAAEELASLSDEQLLPLIQSLREVGAVPDASDARNQLAEVSRAQKKAAVLLKSLSDGLNLHKDRASMQQRLEDLILRQTTNLRQARQLAGSIPSSGKIPAEFAALASVSRTEQSVLKQEVDLTVRVFQRVTESDLEDEQEGFFAAKAEMERTRVEALAASADEAMTAGNFTGAVEEQERLKNGLQSVLLKLHLEQSAAERMQSLAEKIQALAADQSRLGAATKAADTNQQRELLEAQSRLADRLDATKLELRNLHAQAAGEAARAAEIMQQVVNKLEDPNELRGESRKSLAAVQEEAAVTLAAAGEQLSEAAAKLAAAALPASPEDALTALTELSREVAETQAEAVARADGAADAQPAEQLAEKTGGLQQEALPLNPAAAQNLGEAAAQMEAGNAAAAAQALTDAQGAIQQQMADLARAAALQQSLQVLAGQISGAEAEATRAHQSLEAVPAGQAQDAAVRQTEAAGDLLGEAQKNAGNPGTPPDVASALQAAQEALGKSRSSAAQGKKEDAIASNSEARAQMQNALGAIEQAVAGAMAQALPGGAPGSSAAAQGGTPGQGGLVRGGGTGSGTTGNASSYMANSGGAGGPGQVTAGLKPRNREAVAAFQKEKAPPDYQHMAQQYLKNLASGEFPAQPLP